MAKKNRGMDYKKIAKQTHSKEEMRAIKNHDGGMEIMSMGIEEEVFDGFPSNTRLLGAYLINSYQQSSGNYREATQFRAVKIETVLVFIYCYTQEQKHDLVLIATRGVNNTEIPYVLAKALQKTIEDSPDAVVCNEL